jgi:hypothetical protein
MITETSNKLRSAIKRTVAKLIFPCLLFLCTGAVQAQDSLKIILGKKTFYTATAFKGDEVAACIIPAKTMRTAFSTVTVYFGMQQKNTVYKNTLQFVYTTADGTEKTIDQQLLKGKSVFAGATFKKLLNTYKSLKLRLIQSPANPQMSIPTRIRDLLIINTR